MNPNQTTEAKTVRSIKAGDSFVIQGRQFVCLEPKRTRMVALALDNYDLVSAKPGHLTQKEGSWPGFVTAIENAHKDIKPGSTLLFRKKSYVVKKVKRNGDFLVESTDNNLQGVIGKWSPWWASIIPRNCLPKADTFDLNNSPERILAEIRMLRSHKRGAFARKLLRKRGVEAVPFLLMIMGASVENLETVAVYKGVDFRPDAIMKKRVVDVIVDITSANNLKSVLETIAKIDVASRETVFGKLRTQHRYYKQEELRNCLSSETLVFSMTCTILEKVRGKMPVNLLAEVARNVNTGQAHKDQALNFLKKTPSNLARKIVAEIEGKSHETRSDVEKWLHNLRNRKTHAGRATALEMLGTFADCPEAVEEIFRQLEPGRFQYGPSKIALERLHRNEAAPTTVLECCLTGTVAVNENAALFLSSHFEQIKPRLLEIWCSDSLKGNISALVTKVFAISKDPELLCDIRIHLDQKQFNEDEECLADYFTYLVMFGGLSDANLVTPHMEHASANVRYAAWKATSTLDPQTLLSWADGKWQKATLKHQDRRELAEVAVRAANFLLSQSNIDYLPCVVEMLKYWLTPVSGSHQRDKLSLAFIKSLAQVHRKGIEVSKYLLDLMVFAIHNQKWALIKGLLREASFPWDTEIPGDVLDKVEKRHISQSEHHFESAIGLLFHAGRHDFIENIIKQNMSPPWPKEVFERHSFSAYRKQVRDHLRGLERVMSSLKSNQMETWFAVLKDILEREIDSAVEAIKENLFGAFVGSRDLHNEIWRLPTNFPPKPIVKIMGVLQRSGEGRQFLDTQRERLAASPIGMPNEKRLVDLFTVDGLNIELLFKQIEIRTRWIELFDQLLSNDVQIEDERK